MQTLYFATSNERKLIEIRHILSGFQIEQLVSDLPEIQGAAHDIVKHKVAEAANHFQKPVFVDDTHITFEAWNQLPGAYIKDFMNNMGREGLVKMLEPFENKKARAICLIGYAEPGKAPHVFEGSVSGTIVVPRGDMQFSFDPIFQPDGYDRTFSEMGLDQKSQISHRRLALEKFREFLSQQI